MRIISWMVVGASVTTLSWTGIHPLVEWMGLPPVETGQAVGTVSSGTARRSVAVDQPLEVAQAEGGAVAVFRGGESRHTPEFEVRAPWILDWRVASDGGYELAVDVSLERAGTGIHVGNVLKTRAAGNGVRLFDEGGRFYFRVNSAFASWTLKVVELSAEEVEAYTPVTPGD